MELNSPFPHTRSECVIEISRQPAKHKTKRSGFETDEREKERERRSEYVETETEQREEGLSQQVL